MSVESILETILPPNVRAVQTNRLGGKSQGPFSGFNLGLHVGDRPEHVAANRAALLGAMQGCRALHWLEQTHSTKVYPVDGGVHTDCEADASVTTATQQACVVMTADCLPVLFWAENGSEVAAAHAGWRGLLNGVLENSVQAMKSAPQQVHAWLGPCIGPTAFEVGEEVREAFVSQASNTETAFKPSQSGKWLADLHLLARLRLKQAGVHSFYSDPRCTYSEPHHFYSYRREGVTGRMASAIWRMD